MADGAQSVAQQSDVSDGDGARAGWHWLPRTRNTWLLICVIAIAAALGSYVAYEVLQARAAPSAVLTNGYFLAATSLALLPLLLLALDPVESLARGPGLALPFVTTLLLAGLAALAVLDETYFGNAWLKRPEYLFAFFCFGAAALIPRVWNAGNFARHRERNRKAAERAALAEEKADIAANRPASDVDAKLSAHRDAESVAALLSTIVVTAIIVGATLIGGLREEPKLGASLGVGIFAGVVSIFMAVVFLDWISGLAPVRGAARVLGACARRSQFLASFYDWVDRGLVFIGGHAAGADHLRAVSRYSVLAGTLVCLSVLGWFLPAPWGLVPVATGLVMALSVSRLWGWVEEDRSLASITKFSPRAPQKIGFREDFRDETLLGFIFVLVLIPIGMMQAHVSKILGGELFSSQSATPIDSLNFATWLGYFGFELAKALPIVDWADIYNLSPGADSITPIRPLGMHAVFAARAMVDLILIAALLQAIGIASRNRQQKSLYAAEQIDRLDELIEKEELDKAVRGVSTIDFRTYNEERLKELYVRSADKPKLRAFIEQIFKESARTLAPAKVQLENIAKTHRNERDLFLVFQQVIHEHQTGLHLLDVDDIQSIMFELRGQSGLRDFKFDLIREAEKIGTPARVLDLLTTISVGAKPERDAYLYMRREAAETIYRLADRLTETNGIVDSIKAFELNGDDSFGKQAHIQTKVRNRLSERLEELAKPPA